MGEEKQGLGCGAKVGIGCGVLAVIGIVLALVVYIKAKDFARVAGAKGVEIVAEEMMNEAELPEDEKTAAMEPVREFAQQIRDGNVTCALKFQRSSERAIGPISLAHNRTVVPIS